MNVPQSEQQVDRLIVAFLHERADTAALSAVSADEMAARLGRIVTRRWAGRGTPWFRWVRLNRLLTAATVLAVLVVGGLLIIPRLADQRVANPTTTPSASQSPSPTPATPAVVPEIIRGPWLGASSSLPGSSPESVVVLNISNFTIDTIALFDPAEDFVMSASGTPDGALRLTLSNLCKGDAIGEYTWSLSPGGGRLTFTAVSDPCVPRLAMMTGDWYKARCKEPSAFCLGDLDRGIYKSHSLDTHVLPGETWSPTFAALTYTVPDGWANATDWIGSLSLVPSSDYAIYPVESLEGPPKGGTHEIALYAWPAASVQDANCSAANRTDVPGTVDGMIESVGGLPGVSSSRPQTITIDGRDGRWVDVRVAPGWRGSCPGETVPVVELFRRSGAPVSWNLELRGQTRMRLIVLDVGQGDVVLIAVVSDDPDRFDDLVAQSMPIIESFQFK